MNDQIETNLSRVRIKSKIDKEVWIKVKGFEIYEVSNLSRIRTLKSKYLVKQRISTLGYMVCDLYPSYNNTRKKIVYVHRIVAEAFIDNPENKPNVNHINAIRNDNFIDNLEWCTQKENVHHAINMGLVKCKKGENNGHHKLSECDVIDILKMCLICNIPCNKVCKIYDVHKTTIQNIAKGKLWPEKFKQFVKLYSN